MNKNTFSVFKVDKTRENVTTASLLCTKVLTCQSLVYVHTNNLKFSCAKKEDDANKRSKAEL